LVDKLSVLEQQVTGTVENVKGSVETVKRAFDLKTQVRRRPWAALAGAAAVGIVVGYQTSGRNGRRMEGPRYARGEGGVAAAATPPPASSHVFEEEIALVKGLVIGALFGVIRDLAIDTVPEAMGRQVE